MEEKRTEKEEKNAGLARLRRNQGLPSLDPEVDGAVSGLALLLSGPLNKLSSSQIKKIRSRYQYFRQQETDGEKIG